jgi:hypothetical protein
MQDFANSLLVSLSGSFQTTPTFLLNARSAADATLKRATEEAAVAVVNDHRVPAPGEVQHLEQIGPGLRRGGRRSGLHDGQMVDDESRVGVAVDQRRTRVQVAPAQHVDRKVVPNGRAQDPVEARVVRIKSQRTTVSQVRAPRP